MSFRILIAAGAGALTLGLASTALADPDYTYRTSPPASNPHDVFRTVTKVPRTPEAAARLRMAECNCPTMKGDPAKSGQPG